MMQVSQLSIRRAGYVVLVPISKRVSPATEPAVSVLSDNLCPEGSRTFEPAAAAGCCRLPGEQELLSDRMDDA
jgi:hypothetical protein